MQIVIVCLREQGMNRGGLRHPRGATTYESSEISEAQLREILAEPELVVVAGARLTGADLEGLVEPLGTTVHIDPAPATASEEPPAEPKTEPPAKGRRGRKDGAV